MPGFGHIAVGMLVARLRAERGTSRRALAASMAAWSALSLAPDLDVIGFHFGVPYCAPFGHRGATHSFVAALAGAALTAAVDATRRKRVSWGLALSALAVLASHGVLDSMTDGGRGVALLWPFTTARFFAPFRPIPVAPIGIAIFSAYGAQVTAIEVLMFAPLWLWAIRPSRR